MKRFLKIIFWVYFLPFFLYSVLVLVLDPLKCFRQYKEYYKGSFVSPNRENVCLNLFEQADPQKKINSFILGNSCSHAFKINNWLNHLPNDAKGYHLDAYRETVYGILKKVEYLKERNNKIDNVLIVIDRSVFSKKFPSYMYVIPAKIDPLNSSFYKEHLKVLTSVKFITSYAFYSLRHRNYSFMDEFHFTDQQPNSNNLTGDLNYLPDVEIRNDSIAFFKKLQSQQWVSRKNLVNLIGNEYFEGLNNENVGYLKKIKSILSTFNSSYKIIINPLYDQVKLPESELNIIKEIFGKEHVYDFSGENSFTSDFKNYYDGVHYRPIIAEKILDSIYIPK